MLRRISERTLIAFGVAGLLVLLAATATGASGAAGAKTPKGNPASFLSRIVSFIVADDYVDAWRSLYPAHKRVAPRNEYVDCELRNPVGMTLESIEVISVRDRMVRVPGQATAVAAKVVTLRISMLDPVSASSSTFMHAFRAVPSGSRWAWILTARQYASYRDNVCS